MPTRSYVQVAAEGTGKKIANVAVAEPTAVDASGNAQADTTTYQQLVTVADRRGDTGTSASLDDVIGAIHKQNEILLLILEALN